MNDDLSRLLSGELPPDEAAALRARIAADPALAAQWRRMMALPAALAALPMPAPPPALDRAVLAAPAPPAAVGRPEPAWRRWGAAVAALAAGLLVASLLPSPRPEVRVATGSQVVDGRVVLLAGDVPVEVDGKLWVRVEPPRGAVRGGQAEIPTMDKSHFLAALAGSTVTFLLVEGTATAFPADGAPVALEPGQQQRLGPDAAAAGADPAVAARASDREAALAKELALLRLEHAITAGQLRALGGAPAEWPADVPAPYRPAAFGKFVHERASGLADTTVVAVDCDEYPCIAIVRSTDPSDQWQDKLMALHDDLAGAGFGESNGVIGNGTVRDDGTKAVKLYAFSIVEDGLSGEVRSRLDVRVRGDMEGITEELMAEPEPDAATESEREALQQLGYVE